MQKIKINYKWILLFILISILCFFFPYTGDDWAWGSKIGIERLNTLFNNYNGRYFGNLIILVMSRSIIFKTLLMGTLLTIIIYYIYKFANDNKLSAFLILLCFGLMPIYLLRQSIVWSSGFSNYVTSIFITLTFIFISKKIEKKEKKESIVIIVACLFIGLLGCLILENISIYNVILGLGIIVYDKKNIRQVKKTNIAFLFGSIIGTVVMFSNSSYRAIQSGQDSYRTIGNSTTIFQRIVDNLNTVAIYGFVNNVVVNVMLICVLVILSVFFVFNSKNKILKGVYIVFDLYLIFFGIYSVIKRFQSIDPSIINLGSYIFNNKYINISVLMIYIVFVFLFILILPITNDIKLRILFWIISVGVMIAPLLIVTPIGPRNFIGTYILQIIIIVKCMNVIPQINISTKKIIYLFSVPIIIISYLFLLYVYSKIWIFQKNTVENIKHDVQCGNKSVIIQKLPYDGFVWTGDPSQEPWNTRFKLFYKIPKDVNIKVKK
ncbi:MAG: DUF6056 family protein [Lachnospiraceae bacterium]|jgi:membrane-bound ClpP family serine protease|nr:DUF6056 family protein [Lachnospiraceae bacterium]